jgi:hypothetical protein
MNAFNFTRKTLPQKESLGEKMAKKRIALGYDIKDAEKATRIRAKYIEAIENGKYEKLPPDVFVRGFIKNYASFLKLDTNKVLANYEKERGLVENMRKAQAGPPMVKPLDSPKVIITPKTLIVAGISLLALIIVGYISWQVHILTASPKLTLTNPADNINVTADSLYVEGFTDAGASMYINDIEVGVDQGGTFKEQISLQQGVNILRLRAQNKLGKKTELSRTVVATLTEKTNTKTTQTQGIELKVNIGPKSASLLVEVDGKKTTDKAVVMIAGVSQTFKATDKITITTNNAGSIRVSYNGQDVGVLGKDGEQIRREFVKGMQIK